MKQHDVLTIMRLVEYRIGKLSSLSERREVLDLVVADRIDAALGRHAISSIPIAAWEASEKVLSKLDEDQRGIVIAWAEQRRKLLDMEAELRALHAWKIRLEDDLRQQEADDRRNRGEPELAYSKIVDAWRQHDTPISRLHAFLQAHRPDWSSDERSLHKAYIMACWSELAYCALARHEHIMLDRYKLFEPSLIRASLRRERMTINLRRVADGFEFDVEVLFTLDYAYVIARLRDTVIIAVRGTRPPSVEDWMINFTAGKSRTADGYHHAGFDREAQFVQPLLQELVGDRGPLYFTGHSMGAAVAALLSKAWRGANQCKTPYLFACPRFEGGQASGGLRRYAYVRPQDIVPHVPLRLQGFSDGGQLLEVLPASERQRSLGRSLFYWMRTLSADQHMMEHHRRILGVAVGESLTATAYIDAILAALKHGGS